MLGWVVQTCFRSYEHFWSPCHQGNEPCKFCGIQHATSEVSFQYRVFLCRSMDDTTLNNVDNGPQVTIFKGVVKKLDQFLAIIVTHTTKATICRISGLVRNVKRSSSIPFVLFLPSINRPLLKLEVLQQLSIMYRTSNYRSCNNKKRIASSLLIVLTTTCVSFIHLNQVKTL